LKDFQANPSKSITSTLIWANAAKLYLAVVVSGWQLSTTDIRNGVYEMIKQLQTVSSSDLRALAWPLCIAGCLASEPEEQAFRNLLSGQSRVGFASALGEVKQIMEKVWENRTIADPKVLDIAACLQITGVPVLLI
jgi:C6 transcription factor Pro1